MEAQEVKTQAVKVIVSTTEGEVLDSFFVSDWRDEFPEAEEFDDAESVGSPASNSLTGARIQGQLASLKARPVK